MYREFRLLQGVEYSYQNPTEICVQLPLLNENCCCDKIQIRRMRFGVTAFLSVTSCWVEPRCLQHAFNKFFILLNWNSSRHVSQCYSWSCFYRRISYCSTSTLWWDVTAHLVAMLWGGVGGWWGKRREEEHFIALSIRLKKVIQQELLFVVFFFLFFWHFWGSASLRCELKN